MSRLDSSKGKQKPRESMAMTPGQLREKLDGMQKELVNLIAIIGEQQQAMEKLRQNNPENRTYIDEMDSQINRNKETLLERTGKYNRTLELYQRRMSHLQKIKG